MSAGTKKSTNLGIIQGGTTAKVKGGVTKANLMVSSDTVEVATTNIDDVGDVVLFGIVVPTSAIIRSCVIRADDLDSGTDLAYDVGYYAAHKFVSKTSGTKTVRAQDAVLDADALASAITVGQTASSGGIGTEVAFEARDIANVNKTVWEDLGYDEDPGGDVCIGLTVTTGGVGSGTISITVLYSE